MADKMNVSNEAIASLSTQINKVDRKVDRKIGAVNRSINTFKKEVTEKLQPFHDYIKDQEGYQRGVKDSKGNSRGSGLNITPDLIKIILILATVIAGTIGVALQ